jgi:hypothetical protein
LSVTVTEAARLPVAVGVNVTLIVQVAFTAIVVGLTGQLFVCAKSPGFAPAIAMLEMLSEPGPLLVSVIDSTALVVLTVWAPKVRLALDNFTEGVSP